jgi:acetyl esterase
MRASTPAPEAQAVLTEIDDAGILPLRQHGPEGARELLRSRRGPITGPPVGSIETRSIPGYESRLGDTSPDVPVRIYRPSGAGPFPVVVQLHGGGFVLGDLDGAEPFCRHLVAASDCVVVSVDYRLAPEHPFPAALENAIAATAWAASQPEVLDGDGQLAVLGDSAGGSLAAAVCLAARDRAGPTIDHQVLIYPAVEPDSSRESMQELQDGYYLEAADMAWYAACYFGSDLHDSSQYAFPLTARSHADLPAATVLTAGFDPLRDEGVAYIERLRAGAVSVTHEHYPAMIHGFATMLSPPAALERAQAALGTIGEQLREAFD